ncbi:isochorismatase family protein [Microbaculum marinum]|uniref:Isochorismatase family protein n=1 Tax=Microbaculum marinum TaxID=1764581 RepID=A0AAW9RPE6_9HYPH
MSITANDTFEDHVWKDLVPPEILKVFSHYRRGLRVGRRPALVMVDLYNLVYEGGARPVHQIVDQYSSSCGEYAWAAIEPTQRLLAYFRAQGLPVIHVTYDDRPETDHQGMVPTFRKKYAYDPRLYQIKQEFEPIDGEQFIYKKRASAFFGTPLATSLVQQGIDSVVIAGETTSGCVRASAVDSYSYGFHTVIAEDCVFDRSILSHKISLFDLHHKYADVFTTDTLLSALDGRDAGA